MPLVVDDLSLKIRPGQYVALVGASGCGKSTLLRLLLGFETPGKGAIYYDDRDIAGMDLKSLRSRIGVVMQGGRLFSGGFPQFSGAARPAKNFSSKSISFGLTRGARQDIIQVLASTFF